MQQNNNIALIGGSGFLGNSLAKKIKPEQNFIYDIRPSIEFLDNWTYLDVTKDDQLIKCLDSNQIIINLAAEHKDNIRPKQKYYDVNVGGAKNICAAASKKNIKTIVFISSVAVYGFSHDYISESQTLNPISDYGRSKALAEAVYKEWQLEDAKNRTLVIIRPTVIFGPKNRGNLYNLIAQINNRKFFMIGNGKNIKSVAYVENVTDFILFALNFRPGVHLYNYVDEPQYTMNSLIELIYKCLNRKPSTIRIPFLFGILVGYVFDIYSYFVNKSLPISSIRIKKFCSNSKFKCRVSESGFSAKNSLDVALMNFIKSEFIIKN
jgi:nucleoside-diphosphate-sugar epimerase